MSALPPLVIGCMFGFVLHKARMGSYAVIVNVFRFTDFTVLKFLMSGLMVAMLGLKLTGALQLSVGLPIAQTFVVGNLVGGVLFGIGMATAGFCPGTVAAGAGEGRLDYIVPGSLGLYAGALLFGLGYPKLFPLLARLGNFGSVTLPGVLRVDGWLAVALFWELGLVLFYLLERGPLRQPQSSASRDNATHASLRGWPQ
ncbi:MAG TPA: YeeE/YedE thiosulfate transporter family protein [Polyangiales bacterium]